MCTMNALIVIPTYSLVLAVLVAGACVAYRSYCVSSLWNDLKWVVDLESAIDDINASVAHQQQQANAQGQAVVQPALDQVTRGLILQ